MKPHVLLLGAAALVAACAAVLGPDREPVDRQARVDFQRDVRPILVDRCHQCHGPDEATREADLRLDTAEGAYAALSEGVHAVVPGKPEASELVARIHSSDPDEVMPPPSLKRPLDAREREVLVRWIEQGAAYEPHWAFVAPAEQALPAVSDPGWVRDPLDAHVLAALDRRGLAPQPPTDPQLLLRRTSLVLTGLPPTVEDADAFAAEPTPAAFARRVDAMLASARAAEHMATTWLDLARFADTWGYQTDGAMFSWPWRDWLLRALQANMPYDRFVTAILAGDLLPGATVDDRVATAFHRLHRMTEEGGSIAEEFRQEGIADRVSTFGTAFLGLTMECARCHDHKYDPIPARDFYAVAAMFGSIDENGLKPFSLPVSAPPPYVRLATAEQHARTAQLEAEVAAAARAHEQAREAAGTLFRAGGSAPVVVDLPPPAASYAFESLENGLTPNAVLDGKPASTDRHRPEQLGAVAIGEGRSGRGLVFDGDGGIWLDGMGGFGRHDEVSIALWIRPGERNARAAIAHAAGFYTQDADASGIELEIEDGRVRWSAIHLWPGSAASVRMVEPLPLDRWTHLAVTWDGSSRAAGLRIHVDGAPAAVEVVRDALDGPLKGNVLEIGSRSRGNGFRSGAIDELRIWRKALSTAQVRLLAIADGLEVDIDPQAVEVHVVDGIDEQVAATRERLRAAQRALAAHLDAIPTFVCMADSPWAPPTHVLKRGAYDQPDLAQRVEPGAVEAVLAFDPALPRNRLGLAQWLLDPRNPLAARVAVNRLWTQVFGRGLVETAENLGMQGTVPANQQLLDALAHDFVHGDGTPGSAWNVRHLLRRMVLSATFAQASTVGAPARAADPDNAHHARGPSFRLSAEVLRDQALAASGLLVEKLGGPSVRPFQPAGLWEDAGQGGGYGVDQGEGAHRRSLYTFRKRTVPVPNLQAFDAGAREACMPRRSATNTPLQSLVVLNDPVFVECAVALARRATAEAADRDKRIVRAFRLACTRMPTTGELDALRELLATQAARYAAAPADAKAACGIEDPELAALAAACTAILASDAAMVVR